MKGLILLFLLVIGVYIGWVNIPLDVRKTGLKKLKPHLVRVGILIILVITMAYAAYYLTAPSLT